MKSLLFIRRSASNSSERSSRMGFTLIELLVVIAVIALLVSLLLPALGKARKSAQQAISLSNMRSVCQATFSYQDDFKGSLPLVSLNNTRGQIQESQANTIQWLCSWSFAGKNPNAFWFNFAGGWLDDEAADRPLNPYLQPTEMPYSDPVLRTQRMPRTAEDRRTFQIQPLRDPSDKVSWQQYWNDTQTRPVGAWRPSRDDLTGPTGQIISAYDDVGTSYQTNLKWHEQLVDSGIPFGRAFFAGARRLRVADSFVPSQMAWITDQYADIVVYNPSPTFQLRNGYDDFNKSIMGFLDGHAAYLTVIPGRQPESYRNSKYTFIFPDLRVPR